MNYTPSQEEAIRARGENLLISAAAGSGKTRVLVDRIVEMLRAGEVGLSELLVVTFTNAAAGEMKSRLREGLEQAAIEATGAQQAFLREQLEALNEAHISTMHGFCIAELRRYYHVLNLDPGFRILPESMTAILKEDAMAQAMDAGYASANEGFLRLVDAYGGKNGDDDLRDMVRDVHNRIQSHEAPLDWLAVQAERFAEPVDAAIEDYWRRIVEDALDETAQAIARGRALCDGLQNALKYHEMFNEDETILAGIRKTLRAEDPVTALAQQLAEVAWVKKPTASRKASPEDKAREDAIKTLRDAYKKNLTELGEILPEPGASVSADRALIAPHLAALVDLVGDFDAAYRAAKAEKQGLDFNDLEHALLALLHDEEAGPAIRQEIRYIFFDEYQDANPIQEKIVNALAAPDHLFFVGDVKQAIYRFRRADPNIFNARYARYEQGDGGRLISLSENFRSRQEILTFSNALFGTLMTSDLGDVDYLAPGQALVCGAPKEPDEDAVQCVAIAKDADASDNPEALWIAWEIKRLVAEGRYGYGDMAVLMRSPSRRIKDFEEIFKREGIPFYSDNSSVGFHNLEVRLFIAMLRVLSNDLLDEPLLAALLSPFGGLSDEEIALIRLECPDAPFASLCKRYLATADDEIAAKLRRFYAQLARWRTALHYQSLEEVATAMLEESGYGAFLLGMDEGVARYQNVSAFIQLIADYEKGQRYGLAGFLHHLQTLEARSLDSAMPGIALSENDSCVRIMSIHKSKGLGFEVVFLADMARTFSNQDSRRPLVMDDALGIGLNVVDLDNSTQHTSLERSLINHKNKMENLSEEVRLLYVALTRAKDRLVLVASLKADALDGWREKKYGNIQADTATFRKQRSYADWLASCLCDPAHPLYLGSGARPYQWQLVDAADLTEQAAEEAGALAYDALLAQADPAETAAIAARFSTDYAYAEDTSRPFKKTVSQLSKGNNVLPDYVRQWPDYAASASTPAADLPVPDFIRAHVSLTATALGTLMHQIVQLLPLRAQSRAEILAGLDRLEREDFITSEERAAVDLDMLEGFYASDFVAGLAARSIRIEQEASFTMRVEPWLVDGQIDLFIETADGLEIVDFKTDRTMRADRYRAQLDLYARALTAAYHKPVTHKWLYWLRYNTAEEIH